MPKSENKAILEEMKNFFKVDSVEDVAEKLGYKRTTATTWRSKGVSNNAITRYKNLIYESNSTSTPTPSQTSLPPDILELIQDYQELPEEKKEIYRLKIKKEVIDKKLKEKGVND